MAGLFDREERTKARGAGGPGAWKRRAFQHRVPLLTRPFRYASRRALYGRARIFGDRIELDEWGLLGFNRQAIPLESIAELNYHPLANGSNLTLVLENEEVIELRVEDAHLWREAFEHWISYRVLASAKFVGSPEAAADLSG